jgi:hypothetical protein
MTQEVIMLRAELSEAQRVQIINERTLCIYVVVDKRDISSTMVAKTIVCVSLFLYPKAKQIEPGNPEVPNEEMHISIEFGKTSSQS